MDYTIDKNNSLIIDVNTVINSGSNGYWSIGGSNNLIHNSSIGSYIDKTYPFLEEGKTYIVNYSAAHTSCEYRMYLGDTPGLLRSSSGDHSEEIVFTGTNKRLRFWSNGEVSIFRLNIKQEQTIVTDEILPLNDPTVIENKGFTLSYNPIAKQWISFHSYLPNNYIIHPNSLLAKKNTSQVMQLNKGDYGIFFDNKLNDFIVETIFNEFPTETKVFDNITFNLKSEDTATRPTNLFFNEMVLSTEYQCSGEIGLNLTNLTKKERDWCINKFNDLTNNGSAAIFSKNWQLTAGKYPIDKMVNPARIDTAKPWYQRARFRDKFLKVRFYKYASDNNKISCNFVSTIYRPSQR